MTPGHFTEVLFVGFFTAAGLYSALIYLITRDRPFLLYAALMDASAAAQFVFAGDLLGLQAGTGRLLVFRSVCYAAFFLAQAGFARAYLRLSTAPERTSTVLSVVLGLNIVALAAGMRGGPAGPYQFIDHALFVLLLAVCGYAGLTQARGGDEGARFYVI
ncbi:MAG TPA: 7TM diverse intracellular signaling domain-containing protein, partial [Candidatus Baltobacteraceae bacterium]|nr:7TM diverse intracellular signaling domain-containing protein [Candidatus Baltobacteraceae bacterium]